jgi:menaquinone-specific isochorismate synthase
MSCVVSDSRDPERLTVRTIAVPDTGDLLAGLPVPAVTSWVRQGAGLAGWGEAASIRLPAGYDRFAAGEAWLESVFKAAEVDDQVRLRGSGLVAFGAFTFAASSDGSALIIPKVLRGRDGHGNAWVTTIGDAGQPEPVPERAPQDIVWRDGSLSAPQWEQAVARAVTAIKADPDLGKIVLARDLFATGPDPIDARVLLQRLAARYPDCYTFACDGLIGATPELLISRDGDEARALVLAGTTPRGGTPDEDEALGAALLTDPKNIEEHAYAASSIRESLAPLCTTLELSERVLVKLPNLQHLGTHVRGRLASGMSALALAAAVHPTAAVCGTPAGTAQELIRALEQMDRERYAGPVGWIDAAGNGEWGIALRSAQLSGNTARLFAGCGIVAGSVPSSELAETLVKFRPVRSVLEG